MELQSPLGTAGASLRCLPPRQLLLTPLTPAPLLWRLANHGVTPRSDTSVTRIRHKHQGDTAQGVPAAAC